MGGRGASLRAGEGAVFGHSKTAKGVKMIAITRKDSTDFIATYVEKDGQVYNYNPLKREYEGKANTTMQALINDARSDNELIYHTYNNKQFEAAQARGRVFENKSKSTLSDFIKHPYGTGELTFDKNGKPTTKGDVVMTEQDYLDRKSVGDISTGYMLDKVRQPHGITQRQRNKLLKNVLNTNASYAEKRQAARNEYRSLVEKGLIRQPTREERAVRGAQGLASNESVQAMRRICAKLGIDWKTGKRIAKKKK